MNIVKYINNKLSFFSRIKKVYNVLSLIEVKETNGDILISIPNDIVVQTGGNMLIYSKDGVLVTKHRLTHINPDIHITVTDNLDDTVYRAKQKKIVNIKKHIIANAIKTKTLTPNKPINTL